MDRRATDRRKGAQGNDVFIPDIMDIISILFKRKFLILALIGLPTLCSIAYLKFKPNRYTATATVILEDQSISMAEFQDILAGMKFDNLTVPTQVRVIASPDLMRKTVETSKLYIDDSGEPALPEIKSAPEKQNGNNYDLLKIFRQNLKVEQQGTSRIIEISFTARNPETSAILANTHAKQYVYSLTALKKQQAKNLDEWLSKQIIDLKKETLRKSKMVQTYRVESGMVLGRNSEELIYQQITDIAAQLTPIEARELDLKARMEMMAVEDTQSLTEIVESPLVQSLKSRMSEASQKLQSIRADFGRNHPDVIAAQHEVSQIKADITKEVLNIKRSINNELTTVSKQKDLLKEKLMELQKQADTFEEKQITLQSLQLEESASSKLLDNFLARSEEVKSRIDFSRPDARIVSLADVPGEPAGSKKMIFLAAIIVLSSLMALAVVFILEMIDNGIEKKEDVKRILNLRLIGTLPLESNPIAQVRSHERTPYQEEIKRIYIHLSSTPKTKTILFTSARKDEGKSMVVIALAFYLNAIGRKTLVIDADTINPKIADILSLRKAPGFYELMAGKCSVKDAVVTEKSGLHIVPSGEKNPYVSDLLMAGRFEAPLNDLTAEFDFILIDSSPAPEASDIEVLSRLVDQVVLVTAWAKTPRKIISEAAEIIRNCSKTPPFIILNKMMIAGNDQHPLLQKLRPAKPAATHGAKS